MTSLEKLAEQMRADWDRRVSHDYRFWMGEGNLDDREVWKTGAADFQALAEGIPAKASGTALEIGCGIGRMLKAARERFGRVIGVDVSRLAIDKARELLGEDARIELLVGKGINLEVVETNSIDFVWSYSAIACMPVPVIAAYLLEIQRVLKADGVARLQLFLGEETPVHENDTLHLRSFQRDAFARAAVLAGLSCEITFEGSIGVGSSEESDLRIKNTIVTLRPSGVRPAPHADVVAALLPGGESTSADEVDPRALEAWMALNFAESLVDEGDVDRAKDAIEYVVSHCKSVAIDTRDVLERILAKTEARHGGRPGVEKPPSVSISFDVDEKVFANNMAVLEVRFPKVHAQISRYAHKNVERILVKGTKDGATVWSGSTCHDHPEKPHAAAEAWARRSLGEARISGAKSVTVVGFGCGYHLEALLAQSKVSVACCEPDEELFARALRVRDVRPIIEKLDALIVGREVNEIPVREGGELLVRPQALAVEPAYVSKVRSTFYSKRGRCELHPRIAVLGPLHGGTLPTSHYTVGALQRMGQRVRGVDVSGFNDSFMLLDRFVVGDVGRASLRGQYVELMSSMLLESFNEKPIDILICMAQAPISGKALTELRSRGVITVLWFVEDYLRFTYWREMAKYYDHVFTIQKGECLEKIKAAGAGAVHYLPTACDPYVHRPLVLSPEDQAQWGSPVSFVGAGYHNRQQMFARLADLPLKIWGSEWPLGKPFDRLVQDESRRVTPEEYVKIFNATEINLNLHSSSERDGVDPSGDFVNPRTFELAACGAFQLCDTRSHLAEHFEVGKEIITFSSLEELREQISFYRAHPEERQVVCDRARARVLREHTYEHRYEEMLSVIYANSYETLRQRETTSPWAEMIHRAEPYPELKERCERARARGEEPALDGLIADIVTGAGKLSETEQKLLFMHHVRSQIIRMNREESGGRS